MKRNELGKVYTEQNMYYNNNDVIYKRGSLYDGDNLNVVELFCGCGGTSCGFEMAGYDILLGVDIHAPSIETFQANHPSASTILGDIRKVSPDDVKNLISNKKIDVLIGGIPCQGFSLNNKKRNYDDERNFLYIEFLRFVKALQPKVVVIENVSGMKSTKNGEFVETIKKEISEVGNYSVTSAMLNAADYGVPQKRQRLVFVGIRDGVQFDFNDIQKTNGPGTGKEYFTVKDAIGDLPSLKAGESASKYTMPPFSDYQRLMRKNVSDDELTNHQAPNHPAETVERIRNTPQGEPMYPNYRQRIRLDLNSPSPTQVSGGIRPQFQFGHPTDDRGLTIRERCRIQSFPDNYIIKGGIVQGRVQTGNAVPPLLAKALADAIRKYL
jgi:DNA (cytosine-5)-methyltransferase 1